MTAPLFDLLGGTMIPRPRAVHTAAATLAAASLPQLIARTMGPPDPRWRTRPVSAPARLATAA